MSRYVWNRSKRKWVKPSLRRSKPTGPYVIGDTPAYMSPLGTGEIDGRAARREDMARGGCREVDPSERLDLAPKTEADAARERAELAARPRYEMPARTREALLKGE